MNFSDVLILTAKNDSVIGKSLAINGVDVQSIWKNDHYSKRKFKLLSLFGKQELLYGFNKKDILSHNKIIISEGSNISDIVRYIYIYIIKMLK